MRHRKKFNHLGRKAPHRKAMLSNMASSLIIHKRITTTTAKAKALRSFVEPVINRSKEDSTHSRRMAFKHLRDKEAVSELFREVAGKIGDRPGGYTRIIKIGNRLGDNADMCIIELVDFNENLLAEKAAATKPKSARRRRGGGSKKTETSDITETAEEIVEEVEKTKTTEDAAEIIGESPAEEAEDEAPEKEAVAESVVEEAQEEKPAAETPAEEAPAEEEDKEEKKEE